MADLSAGIAEMTYDDLIADVNPRPVIIGGILKKGSEEAVVRRGTLLSMGEDGTLEVLGGAAPKTQEFDGDGSTKEFTVTDKPQTVTSVTVNGAAADDYSYDNTGGKVTFTTAPENTAEIVVTYPDESAEYNAYGILCDDTLVGTDADVNVPIYVMGCFNLNKCITAEGYTLTNADRDAFLKNGIVFKAANE